MSTVKCKVCGKEFESPSGKAMYCSSRCRIKAFEDAHGGTREYRRAQRARNKKAPKPRVCAVCGRTFVPDREGVEYCSPQCRYKRQNIIARVKKNNERAKHLDCYGHMQIQCNVCGKWFVPKPAGVKTCTPCKIFLKYAKEHPDMIQ